VINLARDTDRRRWMDAHLRELGIPFVFSHAVDGNTIPDSEAAPHFQLFREGYGRDMTRGELGCALSHMRLFRQIAAGPDPFVCTIEDDIDISPAILPFLDETTLRSLPPFDVLRLYSIEGRRTKRAWTIATAHGRSIVAPLRTGFGMLAQVMTRAGAAKLADWPITAPVDGIYHDDPPRGLRIVEIRPSLVRHTDAFGSNTYSASMKPTKRTLQVQLRAEAYRIKRMLLTRLHFIQTWGLRGITGLIRSPYDSSAIEREARLATLDPRDAPSLMSPTVRL
jgi:glycosyl transferase family 25